MTIEQVFQLQGVELTVAPDLSVPKAGWKNGVHRVRVVKPNGEQFEAVTNFHVAHFNIHLYGSTNAGRVVISFPSLTKDDLPAGL